MQSDIEKISIEKQDLLDRVRKIILKHGWNSTSYQILNPGITRWFSKKNEALIGFISTHGVWIVAGAPVCSRESLEEVATEFEKEAQDDNKYVCYVAAELRLESIYKNSCTHSKVLLGAQPVWQPKNWESIVSQNKSLRAQLNRAKNKDVVVSEWTVEKATNNPDLQDCLDEWLQKKGLPPLAFLVEPNTLSRLFDRRVFVAKINENIVGFIILSPVATRNGWLFEQFVHRPGAPNGTVELMIDTVMRKLAEENFEYATLGNSPLSVRAEVEPFNNPLWLRILLAWMRKHGQRFYNFDGLDAFKAKLQPEKWEPVFAISNEPQFSFRTIHAISAAFSSNKPIKLFCGGLWRALITEITWLKQMIRNLFAK